MPDPYLEHVNKSFPNIKTVDYILTLKCLKGFEYLTPFKIYEQLIFFLTSDNKIIVAKINKLGKLVPQLLEGAIIRKSSRIWGTCVEVLKSISYEGNYIVSHKNHHGKFTNKQDFVQALIKE